MATELINFRIDKEKARALEKLAEQNRTNRAELLREMVEDKLHNNNIFERKRIVLNLICELKKPIPYLKTEENKQKAEIERKVREEIALELEHHFKII